MVFRPPYPFQMYPGGMPMQMPMQMPMRMPMQMPMQMPMPQQSFFPPGGFPIQPRIPGGFQMPGGIGPMGGPMPTPPVQGASKVGSFLQSANSLFNTAKTYTPYIQQAMPMVKNIPSLIKLYKGFQGLPDADAAGGSAAGATAAEAAVNNAAPRRSRNSSSQNTPSIPRDPIPSKPRIFQPPM